MKVKLCLFLLMTISICNAQQRNEYKLGLTTGYTYANSHFLQAGIIYGKNYYNVHVPALGYGLGSDVGLVQNKLAVGAKAFIEYNPFIITATRIGIIHYHNQGHNDFRVLPEAGISLMGFMNLTYGYSIPMIGTEIVEIGKHRFAISLNFFKDN